jgi:hypothetical protein
MGERIKILLPSGEKAGIRGQETDPLTIEYIIIWYPEDRLRPHYFMESGYLAAPPRKFPGKSSDIHNVLEISSGLDRQANLK